MLDVAKFCDILGLVDTFVQILMVFGFVGLKCGFYGSVRLIELLDLIVVVSCRS